MEIRRTGNTGFIDTGEGQLISFAMGKGWSPSSISFSRPESWQTRKIRVAGVNIVPMGANNDLPGDVQRLLDNFYGGEGIMGKIQGLQWGEGPRFFEEAIDSENNRFYRKWILDDVIQADLESWDYRDYMLRCLVDLVHMQGFWVKFIRNRGPRIGEDGRIIRLEHIPYRKCRFEYPDDRHDLPQNVYVGDWPFPDPDRLAKSRFQSGGPVPASGIGRLFQHILLLQGLCQHAPFPGGFPVAGTGGHHRPLAGSL